MIVAPEIRYAPSGDLSIAYQVVGDAPVDLVIVPGVLDHLDTRWEEAGLIRFVERLARFARVVMLDRRGIGLSDRLPADAASTPAESAADVRAVLDAAGSERAVVLGLADAGFAAVTFAATYPERTRALVLYSSLASGGPRPGYPWGVDDALMTEWTALIEREWGTGVFAVIFGDPSPEVRHAFARMERRACTPRAAVAQIRASLASDVRHLLPTLRVPTLVVQHRDHPFIPVEAARWVVGQIPGARYVEHTFPFSALEEVTGHPGLGEAIEELVTGGPAADVEGGVLAALLFTDIVDSTAHAARLGDRRWHDVLDEHDRRVRATVARGGGRVVKTTGDGVLAQFDGARRAVRCAQAIVEESRRIGLAVRAGVHAGDCERRGDDVAGMTVHVAARVAALAGAGEVLVTAAVRDAVAGTDLAFDERGRHALRGVPGEWALLAARRARRGESAE